VDPGFQCVTQPGPSAARASRKDARTTSTTSIAQRAGLGREMRIQEGVVSSEDVRGAKGVAAVITPTR
jgi:hypothetical protein